VFADVLFLGQRLFVRDIASYYFATKKIVRDTILSGELPFWNRLYAAGQPMAANPEYAVFYPPHALLLLPGYDLWFQVLVAAHVAFGAFGMYRFLRSVGLSGLTAMFGAIAFGFGGLTASLVNLLPYLFILAWLPWAYMNARRWILDGDRRSLAWASLAFGMQILTAEPTTLVQVWLIAGLYVLHLSGEKGGPGLVRLSGRLVSMFVLSVGVGAVQLLPAIDHVGDSVRSLRFPWETVVSWSTPPWRLVELLVPSLFGRPWFAGEGGYWGSIFYAPRPLPFLFSIYCGLPVVVFAIAGFLRGGRAARWVGAGCAAAFVLAIGSATPLFRILYDLGPAQSFRYPEKFLIALLLALLILASFTLERLRENRRVVAGVGVAVALIGLAASAAVLAYLSGNGGLAFVSSVGGAVTADGARELLDAMRLDWAVNAVRFLAFGALFALLGRVRSVRRWTVVLIAASFLDLAIGFRAVTPSIGSEFYEEPPAASGLAGSRDEWRVFPLADWYESTGRSPNGSRFSETGAGTYWTVRNGMAPMLLSAWGFRQVLEIDFDRTALLPTTRMTEALWEIRNEVGDERDATLMAMGSARYRTYFRDAQTELARAGSVRNALPVAFVETTTNPMYWIPTRIEEVRGRNGFVARMLASDPGPGTALVETEPFEPARCEVLSVRETANDARIEVDCQGRSLLVANVTPHRYWNATRDGRSVPIVTANLAYSGIELEAGRQVVEMRYRNPVVAWSGIATAMTLVVLAILGWGRRPGVG
jgi:hypothetical protein